MISGVLFIVAFVIGIFEQAEAGFAFKIRASNSPVLIQIQGVANQNNGWRSPVNSLDHFPLLGPEDCARYGRKYGYPECAGTRGRARAQKIDRQKKETEPVGEALAPALRGLLPGGTAAPAWTTEEAPLQPGLGLAPNTAQAVGQPLQSAVGRLIVITFDGRLPSEPGPARAIRAIKSGAIAGVFLRTGNVERLAQLRALTSFLHAANDAPPIIIIEGPGHAKNAPARISGRQTFPSPREIGARGDPLGAFDIYRTMAAEFSAAGVTMILGPSADICALGRHSDATDCFGSAPQHAAAFANAFNFAHHERTLLTAMRYRMAADRPAGLGMLREMTKREAPDALVVSFEGGTVPETAGTSIASLRDAGFAGAVIFDLVLDPSSSDQGEEMVAALRAGADMIIVGNAADQKADFASAAAEAVASALASGRLQKSRIEDAVRNANSLRARLQAWKVQRLTRGGDTTSSIRTDSSR